MHAEVSAVRFCCRESSWLFCLYKSLNCLWGLRMSMCTNGAVFTGTRRQRGEKQRKMLTAVPHDHRSLTAVLMSAEL